MLSMPKVLPKKIYFKVPYAKGSWENCCCLMFSLPNYIGLQNKLDKAPEKGSPQRIRQSYFTFSLAFALIYCVTLQGTKAVVAALCAVAAAILTFF